jgi:hypothetical protein
MEGVEKDFGSPSGARCMPDSMRVCIIIILQTIAISLKTPAVWRGAFSTPLRMEGVDRQEKTLRRERAVLAHQSSTGSSGLVSQFDFMSRGGAYLATGQLFGDSVPVVTHPVCENWESFLPMTCSTGILRQAPSELVSKCRLGILLMRWVPGFGGMMGHNWDAV